MSSTTSPKHYQFPGGVQTIDISRHLTSNGGQAVQYIARSTRLDGNNKGDRVDDLEKAIVFLTDEIGRIKREMNPTPSDIVGWTGTIQPVKPGEIIFQNASTPGPPPPPPPPRLASGTIIDLGANPHYDLDSIPHSTVLKDDDGDLWRHDKDKGWYYLNLHGDIRYLPLTSGSLTYMVV